MTRHPRQSFRGVAAVEFLISLPLLLLLLLPVADIARVIQANMVLTNISREGANLASRSRIAPQEIMESLAATALPMDMRGKGMIHITKIIATTQNGVDRNVVIGQQRWKGGDYVPPKGAWSCGTAGTQWDANGECIGFPAISAAPGVDVMSGKLKRGDVVYLVEVFYRFPLLLGSLDFGKFSLPSLNPHLYAVTIF